MRSVLRPGLLWLLLGGTILAGLGLAWFFWAHRPGATASGVDVETYKLSMQFALVTLVGGALFLAFAILREAEEQRRERIAALQELYREMDSAYRDLKKVKRSLRSSSSDALAPPYRIPREAFERLMQDFLDAQLKVELLCEHLGGRDDLFTPGELKALCRELKVAKDYYHDIYEDFEYGYVRRTRAHYVVGEQATRLAAFIKPTLDKASGQQPYKAGTRAFDTASELLRGVTQRHLGLRAAPALSAPAPRSSPPAPRPAPPPTS